MAICLLLSSAPGRGSEPVSLIIRPAIVPAMGEVRITAVIEPFDTNRTLQVEAESPNYYRASRVQLEGEEAPRVHTFVLRGLPSGEYAVTARLGRVNARQTVVRRTLQVAP